MPDISRDVTGHLAEDNKTVHAPLAGKPAAEVHAAHNKPGTPVAQQCLCAHCHEHRGNALTTTAA
jgi:hypothetical protein